MVCVRGDCVISDAIILCEVYTIYIQYIHVVNKCMCILKLNEVSCCEVS